MQIAQRGFGLLFLKLGVVECKTVSRAISLKEHFYLCVCAYLVPVIIVASYSLPLCWGNHAPTQGVGVWYFAEKSGLLSTKAPYVATTVW